MAVLPKVIKPTMEIAIDDFQVVDAKVTLYKQQEELQLLIWKNKHLFIRKRNAPSPAAGSPA